MPQTLPISAATQASLAAEAQAQGMTVEALLEELLSEAAFHREEQALLAQEAANPRPNGREMHYAVTIQWSPEAQRFIAFSPEFDRHSHGATYQEALEAILDGLDGMVDVMQRQGSALPEPQVYTDA